MQPGYQQQQQGYQQPAAGYQQPMTADAGGGGAAKKNPLMLVAGILLGVFVFCNWLVGSFKIDGDGGRFLSHTGVAAGTAGLGILMLTGFNRLIEKDKDHPVNVGLGLVICLLIIAIVTMGNLLHLR